MDIAKFYNCRDSEIEKLGNSQKHVHYYNYQRIVNILKPLKNKTILDVGCGDGYFGSILQRETNSAVYGIDISSSAVKKAIEKGIKAKVCNLNTKKIPFASESFDICVCSEIIEHVLDPDELLNEINRVLKKGGLLIVTTPNLASWDNKLLLLLGYQPNHCEVSFKKFYGSALRKGIEDVKKQTFGHLRCFTKKALIQIINEHGFIIKKVQGSFSFFDKGTIKNFGVTLNLYNLVNKIMSKISASNSQILIAEAEKI